MARSSSQSGSVARSRPRFFPSRLALGLRAERAALDFLQSQGLTLIARNVRFRVGEIDLVLRHGDCLVFVEVRSRLEGSWEAADVALPFSKRMRLWNAIEIYLSRIAREERAKFREIRIDFLATDGKRWFWKRNIELLS